MKTFLHLLVLGFVTIGFQAQAQVFMSYGKPGKKKKIVFYPGSEITFRLADEKIHISGRIEALTDTSIRINDGNFPLSRIDRIVDYQKWKKYRAFSKTAVISATSSLFLGAMHNIINLREPPFDSGTLTVAAGMVVLAAITYPFKVKRYRINNRKYLRIVNIPW